MYIIISCLLACTSGANGASQYCRCVHSKHYLLVLYNGIYSELIPGVRVASVLTTQSRHWDVVTSGSILIHLAAQAIAIRHMRR